MRIPRIYTSLPLDAATELALDPRAAHYLGQVLRMKVGRELLLFNGDGFAYPAVITTASKKNISCKISAPIAPIEPSPTLPLELGIAISKGDRLDWVIQKATELGVQRISPLTTERVDVKLNGERLHKKQQHWQQVMISACEQCGRNRLVDIAELQTLDNWRQTLNADLKLVLYPIAETGLAERTAPASAALLIGPEGGLSEAEIIASRQSGFEALKLGPRVLRTETAPLAALSILQFRWGDMG